jgi:hypothetical protein
MHIFFYFFDIIYHLLLIVIYIFVYVDFEPTVLNDEHKRRYKLIVLIFIYNNILIKTVTTQFPSINI